MFIFGAMIRFNLHAFQVNVHRAASNYWKMKLHMIIDYILAKRIPFIREFGEIDWPLIQCRQQTKSTSPSFTMLQLLFTHCSLFNEAMTQLHGCNFCLYWRNKNLRWSVAATTTDRPVGNCIVYTSVWNLFHSKHRHLWVFQNILCFLFRFDFKLCNCYK